MKKIFKKRLTIAFSCAILYSEIERREITKMTEMKMFVGMLDRAEIAFTEWEDHFDGIDEIHIQLTISADEYIFNRETGALITVL